MPAHEEGRAIYSVFQKVGRVVVATAMAATCAGCAYQDTVTLGFGASDVESIEVFAYPYSSTPTNAQRWEVDDRREIASVVEGFTDVPVQSLGRTEESLRGGQAGAYRLHLRGGGVVDVTRVFLDAHQVVLFWPDGSVMETEWGAPASIEYFPSAQDSLVEVDGQDVPEARLP